MEEFLTYLGTFPQESLTVALFIASIVLSTGAVPGNIDLAVLGSGLLIATGKMSMTTAFPLVLFGAFIGEGVNTTLARHFGKSILTFKPIERLLSPETVKYIQRKTKHNNVQTCLLIRFSPVYKGTLLFTASALALTKQDYFRIFVPLTVVYVLLYQSLVVFTVHILDVDVATISVSIFAFLLLSCIVQWWIQRRWLGVHRKAS